MEPIDWSFESTCEFERDCVVHNFDPGEPPCTCYYVDVDLVQNRWCEAHG
jgi:hypothetical protein